MQKSSRMRTTGLSYEQAQISHTDAASTSVSSATPRSMHLTTRILAALFLSLGLTSAIAYAATSDERAEVEAAVTQQRKLRYAAPAQVKLPRFALADALDMREKMLGQFTNAIFTAKSGRTTRLTVRLQDHPDWLVFDPEKGFYVHELMVSDFLRAQQNSILPAAVTGFAQNPTFDRYVTRATMVGMPKGGYVFDYDKAARSLAIALEDGRESTNIPVAYFDATLELQSASGTQTLTLLGRGKSNFANSPWGRRENIALAMNRRLHGVVIASEEEFSFNQALRGASGWKEALVIVDGWKLVKELGGGICQAATTMYRAALISGLPITERANHSLYVTYYKMFGVGVDATVYAGKQDLNFRNDTGHPIVIVAHAEGDDAFVEMYGVPDGRTVSMEGPYFAATKPDSIDFIGKNQIIWTHDVTYPTGYTLHTVISSIYNKGFSKKLAEEFPTSRGINELLGTGTGSAL
jgi:vancomycin resistance protein YoaR